MTTTTNPAATTGAASDAAVRPPPGPPPPVQKPRRPSTAIGRFYASAVGKKWVMAVTGLVLMVFVLGHLIGNLKLYLSKEEINLYGEALRDLPGHLLPHTVLLWSVRVGLVAAFFFHIHSAYGLTRMNMRARPDRYQSKRDYVAADFASRTMRWTGIIVGLYILFHLADLTWGSANPDFLRGDPYNNVVYSMQRPVVAIIYILGNLALAVHLYHGAWSMFQSMGINNPRINKARRGFAIAFASLIAVGNLSFPIAVQLGAVDLECPHTEPTTQPCSQT